MRDNLNTARSTLMLAPLDLNTDRTSAVLDTRGADAVKIQIATGGFSFTSTNKVSWRLQHSVNGTDFDPVVTADVIGVTVGSNGQLVEYVATVAAGGVLLSVGYKGARRYLRVVSVKGGTVTGAIGAIKSEETLLSKEPAAFAVAS
jgi:hypothetical protein